MILVIMSIIIAVLNMKLLRFLPTIAVSFALPLQFLVTFAVVLSHRVFMSLFVVSTI